MNSVFKLLIALIVAGLLLYIIFQLFVFPKSDPYLDITSTITKAITVPGDPVCSKLSLNKEQSLNTNALLQSPSLSSLKLFVWFNTTTDKYTIFKSKEYSVFNTKDSAKDLDFCSICYPGLLFSSNTNMQDLLNNKNIFCEIVFGTKYSELQYNFNLLNDTENQGVKNISITSMPEDYYFAFFILNNENKEIINNENLAYLNLSPKKQIEYSRFFSNKDVGLENNVELSKSGLKIILQAILPNNLDPFSNIIYPAKFFVKTLEVLPNNEYQSKTCVPTKTEKQYIDMDVQLCVSYNYCDGCIMADQCADAWNKSGIFVEPVSPKYAKSYSGLENSCP